MRGLLWGHGARTLAGVGHHLLELFGLQVAAGLLELFELCGERRTV